MKKTLVFLLLVCISLFTLTGCGKVSTKKAATEDEIEEFFEDKFDAFEEMMEDGYSFSFKYSEKRDAKRGSSSSSYKMKAEGRVTIDPDKMEKSAMYAKGSMTSKGVSYGEEGKVKSSSKQKIEVTVVNETLYEALEYTEKDGESKWEGSTKEKTDVEDRVSSTIASYLSQVGISNLSNFFIGNQYYIDGDKCLVITSTTEGHSEVLLKFDGDDLESIQVLKKSYGYEAELTIKFGKVKSISKPSNSSKYKED